MEKIFTFWEKLSPKKKGFYFIGMGLLCLLGCLLLLIFTESIFSTVLLYFSLGLNIVGLYMVLWVKDGKQKNEKQ